MYAIIQTGGKQYKVTKDSIIDVEKLEGDSKGKIVFRDVLLTADKDDVKIGKPHIGKAEVTAEFISSIKSKKVVAFKYRRRKNSKTKKGHRQQLARVRIKEIRVG